MFYFKKPFYEEKQVFLIAHLKKLQDVLSSFISSSFTKVPSKEDVLMKKKLGIFKCTL